LAVREIAGVIKKKEQKKKNACLQNCIGYNTAFDTSSAFYCFSLHEIWLQCIERKAINTTYISLQGFSASCEGIRPGDRKKKIKAKTAFIQPTLFLNVGYVCNELNL
jgi:hypothetical protein